MNGAQLRAVGRQVGSPGFLFISAGTPTADVANVMASSQWDVVIKALAKADLTLVMYAPADLPGLDTLLTHSTSVLLLGGDLRKADGDDPDLSAERNRPTRARGAEPWYGFRGSG